MLKRTIFTLFSPFINFQKGGFHKNISEIVLKKLSKNFFLIMKKYFVKFFQDCEII